ncbi:MAG TPA: dihydrofolate reductase family protein [Puia sp.]|nr:dihydrofolate reductase family protein [Puia sp.]
MSKITIHMVASLDGYIAKKDNSVSWFETADTYDKGVTGEDAGEFLKTIDCYVMGARTYEHALALSRNYGWPYGDTPTVVVTRRDLAVERPNIELYSGELEKLVSEQLEPRFGNVWVVGGAALVKDFLRVGLADEIRMPILPIMLGDGLRFFDRIEREQALHLKDVTAYKNGMVELWYEIKK